MKIKYSLDLKGSFSFGQLGELEKLLVLVNKRKIPLLLDKEEIYSNQEKGDYERKVVVKKPYLETSLKDLNYGIHDNLGSVGRSKWYKFDREKKKLLPL